jgi:DNA polymerase III sliding clamp (beta) subunit (PCNA family)
VLEAADGLKPAILRGEGDDSFTYLLMPVRLS